MYGINNKKSAHFASVVLALSFMTVLCSGQSVSAAEQIVPNDIKPALSKVAHTDINEEQMRLAKVIHKKIIETQAKEAKQNDTFKAYTDKMLAGIQIEMQPIKTKPFVWKGEEKDDTLKVTLDDFWMASTETTWAAYDAFYATDSAHGSREKDGSVNKHVRPYIKNDLVLIARPTPQYHPVTHGMPKVGYSAVGVTHHAANKFCQWLSFQTGHFYRLPTEAEWEYACRGGSKKIYSWGDDLKSATEFAWFGQKEGSVYHKAKQKKPNAYGLYDMHGNVLELTLDAYVENRKKHFGKDKVRNPWVKATKPYPHVTKGGQWKYPLEKIVASARTPTQPRWKRTDPQNPKSIWAFSNAPFLGFRVVRPVTIPTAKEIYHYWNSGTELDGEMATYK